MEPSGPIAGVEVSRLAPVVVSYFQVRRPSMDIAYKFASLELTYTVPSDPIEGAALRPAYPPIR